jgi:ABC-type branched-subunit amino acid transport system ATPase component
MFHCNYLTYSWNNITLEFIEKTSGKSKRKERYLAFKAISYVHFQEKVLFKIMTMLDLLMVYAKIAEPHLRRNIFSMDDYYQKTAELNAHCEHIKRVFIRKIEKNYQTLQDALSKG